MLAVSRVDSEVGQTTAQESRDEEDSSHADNRREELAIGRSKEARDAPDRQLREEVDQGDTEELCSLVEYRVGAMGPNIFALALGHCCGSGKASIALVR